MPEQSLEELFDGVSTQNPWQTKQTRVGYENPWIRIDHSEVITPGGGDGIYGVVHFKNLAIGIVPIDQDGNTWLVGQYRYPLDLYSWEIPEGGVPHDEDPLAGAQRELQEETGITASKWTKILDLHTSNSVTDEAGMSFVAQDLQFGESEPEETEELVIKKVPIQQAIQWVWDGVITDSLSMVSLMKVDYLLRTGQL